MSFDRFLRYTTPGLVSLLYFYFIIVLNQMEEFGTFDHSKISLGYIAGLVVVSGGLGAIFNILYWSILHLFYYPLNHVKLIRSLKKDFLTIKNLNENEIEEINKREAWTIFNTYWYSKTSFRTKFEQINPRIDRLSDVTHGIGTTLMGFVLTFGFSLFWFISTNQAIGVTPVLIAIAIISLTFINYVYSLGIYQKLLNTTFASVISEEVDKKENNGKIEIYLTK